MFTNGLDCLVPLILREVIDNLSAQKPFQSIIPVLGFYVVMISFVAIFRYGWRVFFGRYHHTVAEDLRNKIFYKFTSLGPAFFDRHPVGQLMSLITSDVNYFRMGIGPAVLLFFDAIFYCLTIIPIMIYLSPSWTLKTLIAFPLVPVFVAALEKLIQSRFVLRQNKFSELTGISQEIVSGIRVIKSFALEKIQTRLFNKVSREYEKSCNRSSYAEALLEPMLQLCVVAAIIILFFVGTPQVVAGTVTLGTFIAFLRYVQKLMWPMTEIGYGLNMVLEARASFSRISEVLEHPLDVPDLGLVTPLEFQNIKIKDLTFSYSQNSSPALNHVCLDINRGENIGLFGSVGSGKTALINLLCRLYDPPKEKIFLNGHPIENIKINSLRELICVVPQNVFVFGDSIAANLALGLGKEPTLKELENLSRTVNLHDEIISTEKGYDTLLGEKGVNLSGGQKQRLTIGRGLIRNSQVVVLDDVLSAVDAETEKAILQNLKRQLSHQTIIVASHRIASLTQCDRIYVFDHGKIIASGSHQQLLNQCDFYKNIYILQTQKTQLQTSSHEVQT